MIKPSTRVMTAHGNRGTVIDVYTDKVREGGWAGQNKTVRTAVVRLDHDDQLVKCDVDSLRVIAFQQTCDHIAAVLNRALEADRMAVEALFRFRVRCNQELADDPTVVVRELPDGTFSVALLGIINGLLTGEEVIFMEVEDFTPNQPFTIKEFKVGPKSKFQSGECPVCHGDEYLQPCPKCGGLEP